MPFFWILAAAAAFSVNASAQVPVDADLSDDVDVCLLQVRTAFVSVQSQKAHVLEKPSADSAFINRIQPGSQAASDTSGKKQMHFVYTTGCDEYQLIQSIVLDHSWKELGNRGKLTRIVGGCKHAKDYELLSRSPLKDDLDFAVFFAKGDIAVVPRTGERYPARARPVSIAQWLNETNPKEEVMVILDPDMVSLRPLSEFPSVDKVRPGLMVAQRYGHGSSWYNYKDIGEVEPEVSQYDKVNIYATGPPWMLATSDLERILPQWTYYTDTAIGDALMREQNAFNMAALKQNIPSTGEVGLMISNVDASGEAWDNDHPEPWQPYVLHYCGSFHYGTWDIHKALPSNGWYAAKFVNTLPTVIECGAPLLEEPPRLPTIEEEPDIRNRRGAFMIKGLISSLKKAVIAYRGKYCGKEDESKLGLMREMQPVCDGPKTRYRVERPSESWMEHHPLGGDPCSSLAQEWNPRP